MAKRALEWFAGSVLVYVVVAACAVVEGDEPQLGSKLLSELASPVAEALAEDGSRIVAVYQLTPDGLKAPTGTYFDKQLDAACTFRTAGDGKSRCIPTDYDATPKYFKDSACTIPLLAASLSCNSTVEWTKINKKTAKCPAGPAVSITRRYTMGTAFLAAKALYATDASGSCGAVSPLTGLYNLVEVPPASYVEGELYHE